MSDVLRYTVKCDRCGTFPARDATFLSPLAAREFATLVCGWTEGPDTCKTCQRTGGPVKKPHDPVSAL